VVGGGQVGRRCLVRVENRGEKPVAGIMLVAVVSAVAANEERLDEASAASS
jgi:hypothetical protein